MNKFINYLQFKEEMEKYKKLNDSFKENDKMSEFLKKYDDLYKQFKKIKSMEQGKFTKVNKNEEDFINEIDNRLKKIYFNKMSSALSCDSQEISEGCIRGILADFKLYKSKYFNGIIQSFITDIERVLDNINVVYNNYNSYYNQLINNSFENKIVNNTNYDYDDPLYNEIVEFCINTGVVSASLLQRKYRLGYNRAARMIDLLEERGVISEPNGSKPRKVLINNTNTNDRVVISNINDLDQRKQVDFFSEEYGDDYNKNVQNFFKERGIKININAENNIDFSALNNSLFTNTESSDVNELVNLILENSTPDVVKLLLIDYSRINLTEYNGMPHLLAPVITDSNKSIIALKKAFEESERRYDLFLETKVKNIVAYNNKISRNKIPYIVVVINEFSELLKVEKTKEVISKLFLNCKNAGIVIMAFSKFKRKNIQLFMLEDLFKIYNNYSSDFITNKQQNSGFSIDNIDNDMDGFEFEKYTGDLLKANGFNRVEVTQSSNDYGVDIIAYKDDIKYAIQCKKYSSPVGIKAVQEVIGSKAMNGCHVGVVLTNNTFTKSAKELAEKNNVLLWDRSKLLELIENFKNL